MKERGFHYKTICSVCKMYVFSNPMSIFASIKKRLPIQGALFI